MKRNTLLVTAILCALSFNSEAQKLSAGYQHTTFVKDDGTAWSWGSNQFQALGYTGVPNQLTPRVIDQFKNQVKDIDSSNLQTALVTKNGDLYYWGVYLNQTPTKVAEITGAVRQVSLGDNIAAALTTAGEVWLYGVDAPGWHKLNVSNIIQIDSGYNHVLMLTASGEVYVIGQGSAGQLGLGNTSDALVPTKLPITNIKQVNAGNNFSYAVTSAGQVYAWGTGGYGQLGLGSAKKQLLTPQLSKLTNVVEISAGGMMGIAVHSDSTVSVLGWHNYIGSGLYNLSWLPAKMRNVTGVQSVETGHDFTFITYQNGSIVGWGGNLDGKLGIGNQTEMNTFANVVVPETPVELLAKDKSLHDDNGHGNDPGKYDPSNPGQGSKQQ